MFGLETLDALYVAWAFFVILALCLHFALRKRFYKSYTLQYGWWVYTLCIPAAEISLMQWVAGRGWSFWLGGVLFVLFAAFGYWVDYVRKIPWRKPLRPGVMIPYVGLYLAMLMFYWFPMALIYKPLWYVYAVLFAIATALNVTSH